MKIVALSQVYWPDTASVSQHLTDLLEELAKRGHEVTVLASRNDYEDPEKKYQVQDYHNGVSIIRIAGTSFGKSSKIGRIIDFISFLLNLALKLLFYRAIRIDKILGLTSPPLISFVGLLFAKVKRKEFIYWTMDLQPELSVVAGYIKQNSSLERFLVSIGDYIFKSSNLILTLDQYMKVHIQKRVGRVEGIEVVPVWPVMQERYTGSRENNPFRISNDFEDKIVIMYSGNHSVMHPLTTLLETAVALKNDPRYLFIHIGGGVRISEVKHYIDEYNLTNIRILPYQPRESIHLSLGSADIQVVSLGNGCVGFTHPNKIYGAMFIGKPILYIGPQKSHITDILNDCDGNISVEHNDSSGLTKKILEYSELSKGEKNNIGFFNRSYAEKHFSPSILINQIASHIEA